MSEEGERLDALRRIREKNCGGYEDKKLFAILYDLLEDDILSPDQAVERIVGGFSPPACLWSSMIEHFDPRHLGQDSLALMIEALSQTTWNEDHYHGKEFPSWKGLPLFEEFVTYRWTERLVKYKNLFKAHRELQSGRCYGSIEKWVNFNSFAARLLGKNLVKCWKFAVWALQDALDNKANGEHLLEERVLVACEWILHAGNALFHMLSKDKHPDGLDRETWAFWKRRFYETYDSDRTAEFGSKALSAARGMELIEVREENRGKMRRKKTDC
ncbi:hypothetical protein ASPZODRAFT_15547 [Penicilliopsis zonata CBS 506.65]|uniref:Uncharacterized protein n=1 Tax=Penicilliopsis zonata CBS 506.65 TaxID=1073090 RepID=A0A1L9SI21_9EURO|nr:hypothetical protein ASPZODRAFT_15547 [Penicilliopsis zonata CBS 506.65]OJJ46855.1 hypothetical protein ASPZODRAFT_15547 [Penicilliopsis zonata CBS 506.65]